MSPIRLPIRSPINSAIRSAFSLGFGAVGPRNSATAWYFGTLGLAGTPWNDLSRTGLGTRIGPTGLVEYGPHNLLTWSEDFSNAAWLVNGGAIKTPNYAIAPDGSLTACRAQIPVGGNLYAGSLVNSVRTRGFWIKATDGTTQNIIIPNTTNVSASANAGWQFVSRTTDGGSAWDFQIQANASTTVDILVWHPQTCVGTAVTDYVPTTTSARYLPRIDYDPVTLAARGLLVEGQATNLVGKTEDFADAYWVKVRSSVSANSSIAPDGTSTADKIIEDTSNDSHLIFNNPGTAQTIGLTYTVSFFAKAAGRNWLNLVLSGSTAAAYFDVANGTLGTVVNGTATIKAHPNGWYLCSLTYVATDTSNLFFTQLANANGSNIYAGDGSSGMYLWGAQNVAGAVPTSYIPNPGTGTTVRVADDWALIGSAFTSAIDPSVGTLFVEFEWSPGPSIGGVFSITDNTTNNRIDFRAGQGTGLVVVTVAGVAVGEFSGMGVVTGLNKFAISWSSSGFNAVINNGTVRTNASNAACPAADRLLLGNISPAGSGFQINNRIRSARSYRGQYITDAALQALTA